MSCGGGGGVGSVEVTVDSSEQIKINDFPRRARALYFSITVHRHELPLSNTHTHAHTESSADSMCAKVCVGKRQEMLLNPQTHTEFPLSYALTHTRNHISLGRLCFN